MTTLTKEQIEIRRVRFPASTGPGFLGYGYQSPRQTWEVHMGFAPFEGNANTDGGHDFEEAIAAAARHEQGEWWNARRRPRVWKNSINPSDDTLIDPRNEWLCATPDFVFHPEDGEAIQVKNHQPHMRSAYRGKPGDDGRWDNNLVPVAYLIQCQLEMIVLQGFTGILQLCVHLVSHFGGPTPRVYTIRRDERLQATLLQNAWKFWALHIDPNGPMEPPDDSTWKVRPPEYKRGAPKLTSKEILAAPLPAEPQQPASELAGNLFKL